jgi:hypothetical protein
MKEDYPVPMTQFSVSEREEYQRGMRFLSHGDIQGLEIILRVLDNSRPFTIPERPEKTLDWAVELIEAYRKIGKAIREINFVDKKLLDRLKGYEDLIPGEDKDFPYQPLFDALDEYRKISMILNEHEIDEPEKLREVLERMPNADSYEGYPGELEKFRSNF